MSLTRILPFKPTHADQIKMQSHDLIEFKNFTMAQFEAIAKMKHQYSIEIDGCVKACCGLIEFWPGRTECWAMIDQEAGDSFIRIVRAMKKFFDEVDCQRIEATVICDFEPGHRLVKLLGFELEAFKMRKYGVTGFDYSLYSRVK